MLQMSDINFTAWGLIRQIQNNLHLNLLCSFAMSHDILIDMLICAIL